MIVEWVSTHIMEFPEEELNKIVEEVYKIGWDEDTVHGMILDVVSAFDDSDYYTWNESAEEQIFKEIKRRVGGVQLSMFD